jgi:serine phosphatase RsbU (regulator of sigma subunit)
MNAALTEDNEQGMFVTMFIGLANLTTGHLDFCNAGHNPPIIKEGTAEPRFIEMESNAPLGLWPGIKFVGEEIDSILDSPLFIYTDGLNEAENREQQQFGDDRLLDTLSQLHANNAREVVEALETAVEAHRDGADPNDDLTMMCLYIFK